MLIEFYLDWTTIVGVLVINDKKCESFLWGSYDDDEEILL